MTGSSRLNRSYLHLGSLLCVGVSLCAQSSAADAIFDYKILVHGNDEPCVYSIQSPKKPAEFAQQLTSERFVSVSFVTPVSNKPVEAFLNSQEVVAIFPQPDPVTAKRENLEFGPSCSRATWPMEARLGDSINTTSYRAVPYFDQGKEVGLKIFGFDTDSLAAQHGFKIQDIIKSVNGIPLTNKVAYQKFEELLRQQTKIEAVVLRHGKEEHLVWEPQQKK